MPTPKRKIKASDVKDDLMKELYQVERLLAGEMQEDEAREKYIPEYRYYIRRLPDYEEYLEERKRYQDRIAEEEEEEYEDYIEQEMD